MLCDLMGPLALPHFLLGVLVQPLLKTKFLKKNILNLFGIMFFLDRKIMHHEQDSFFTMSIYGSSSQSKAIVLLYSDIKWFWSF